MDHSPDHSQCANDFLHKCHKDYQPHAASKDIVQYDGHRVQQRDQCPIHHTYSLYNLFPVHFRKIQAYRTGNWVHQYRKDIEDSAPCVDHSFLAVKDQHCYYSYKRYNCQLVLLGRRNNFQHNFHNGLLRNLQSIRILRRGLLGPENNFLRMNDRNQWYLF